MPAVLSGKIGFRTDMAWRSQEVLRMRLLRLARFLVLPFVFSVVPVALHAQVRFGMGVSINVGFAPPVLPVYVQPMCPEPNLMWTPGYWAYGGEDYFWVPGATQ